MNKSVRTFISIILGIGTFLIADGQVTTWFAVGLGMGVYILLSVATWLGSGASELHDPEKSED